jgi:peroxiredoxin
MESLYRALGSQAFELIAVSVDQDRQAVEEFTTRMGLTFPILLDPEKKAADAYQSYRFPESYLIDREGVLVARYIGPRDWDAPAYLDRIRRLLEAPAVD